MNKQEKQRQWIKAQGYIENSGNRIFVSYFDYEGLPKITNKYSVHCFDDDHVLGVFKDKQFIPMPQFEDDQPEPVDKALQEYLSKDVTFAHGYVEVMQEFNNRLKALEAKTK